MSRVLLINPPSPEQLGAPLLGVQYVAAALLARGCEVRVIDAAARYFTHDFDWIVAQAEQFAPDLVGWCTDRRPGAPPSPELVQHTTDRRTHARPFAQTVVPCTSSGAGTHSRGAARMGCTAASLGARPALGLAGTATHARYSPESIRRRSAPAERQPERRGRSCAPRPSVRPRSGRGPQDPARAEPPRARRHRHPGAP